MNASSPAGPWQNTLGVPLMSKALGQKVGTTMRDPAVFVDADGAAYMVSGVFKYVIAKLGPDMMSFAEDFKDLAVLNPTGPYGGKTDDKAFLHRAPNGLCELPGGAGGPAPPPPAPPPPRPRRAPRPNPHHP